MKDPIKCTKCGKDIEYGYDGWIVEDVCECCGVIEGGGKDE